MQIIGTPLSRSEAGPLRILAAIHQAEVIHTRLRHLQRATDLPPLVGIPLRQSYTGLRVLVLRRYTLVWCPRQKLRTLYAGAWLHNGSMSSL